MKHETTLNRDKNAVKLNIGDRNDFNRLDYANEAGLGITFYKNGGTQSICLGNLMVSQLEGHPFQGGLDRVYLRLHASESIQSFPMSGSSTPCAFHENGARWSRTEKDCEAAVELVLHPELPILYRICHVKNTSTRTMTLDWMTGQDIGLADPGALKSNEAYVCQYLDHKIVVHPIAEKTVLSRNNLMHPVHPFAASFCLQGAKSASTDGYQFFGTSSKMNGVPAALGFQSLEDRVKQYEFAYTALQSRKIELQPCQSSVTVFAMYVLAEHPMVSSADDLVLVDETLKADLPELGAKILDGNAGAFFADAPWLASMELEEDELYSLFGREWRHTEYSDRNELYSFFCGQDTHVVLPAKEAVVERQHGTILKSAHGAELDDNVLCVTCFGCGAFGSQFSLGNTSFGRFTTILRNSLNLDRSSGIRFFEKSSAGWSQLGFPSVFAMERDQVRWIYKTGSATFEITARATSRTIEYSARGIIGACPQLRMTIEVCGDANEFDSAPSVTWDEDRHLLSVIPAEGSLLKNKFPDSCILMQLDGETSVGNAERLAGDLEPYLVIDFSSGEFSFEMTGHLEGSDAARARLEQEDESDWNALMANFGLKSGCSVTAKLSDTLKWFAHNAMIHFAAPRGIEQYGGGAWGTRDVCQGPLEFLLSVGHDSVAADLICETFTHQFPDTGNWPQWFMRDGFRDIQQRESHGDVVFWPIKALCDYIKATGDFQILGKKLPYTDPESFELTDESPSLHEHVKKAVDHIIENCVEGTALPSYGDGDWNDSLQPANQTMKTHMVSGWTVGLAYQALSALITVLEAAGYADEAAGLSAFLGRMFNDFQQYIIKDGVAAGFVLFDGEKTRHLLHPSDRENGISYRLLPINRSIISGLFTPEEKDYHLGLVEQFLKFPDGVRLMDRPPEYTGGKSIHFQRAETASHFGREIGLQYVHAHIRYCEALAKVGRAEELLEGLLVVSPVAIRETVANARPRQANLYFSSADAEVYNRYEASASMGDLKKGYVGSLGGWRLYSSGPGIYIGLVISRLFGIRRSYGCVVIDPVLPKSMNGVELDLEWNGKRVKWIYHVERHAFAPAKVVVNGIEVADYSLTENPYRTGGCSMDAALFDSMLTELENTVDVYL